MRTLTGSNSLNAEELTGSNSFNAEELTGSNSFSAEELTGNETTDFIVTASGGGFDSDAFSTGFNI